MPQLWIVRRHSRFMKTRTSLIVAALLASLVVGCSKKPAVSGWSSSSTIVLPPDISIDSLHSGMTVQEVIATLGQPSQTNADGLEFKSIGLFICPGTGEVTLVPPSAGRTKEGIGMGSSRADLVKAYGEPSSDKVAAKSGVEWLGYSPSHMSFQLRDGKVDWMDISTK
jgi:hypothetical protein